MGSVVLDGGFEVTVPITHGNLYWTQTSDCQAGIMFGANFDISSFRRYDKDDMMSSTM